MPPSPAIQLSADGVSWQAPGNKLQVSANGTVHARLDSTAGVNQVSWTVVATDGSALPGSIAITTSGAIAGGEKAQLTALGAGTAGRLQATINAGVGVYGNVDLTSTQSVVKWWVPAANGLEVGTVGEGFESDAVNGTAPLINAAIKGAAVGGGTVDVNPTPNTIPERDGTGGLRALSFAGGDSTVAAAAGMLRGPVAPWMMVSQKGATHSSVWLLGMSSGDTIQIGDGAEVAHVDVRGASIEEVGSATYLPIADPVAPSSGWKTYTDNADGRLKAKSASGQIAEIALTMLTPNTKTLNASNTTAHVSVFQVAGTIEVVALYGRVTTTLGNHANVQFTLWDGTTRTQLTANPGPSATGFGPGSSFIAGGLPTTALTFLNGNAAAAGAESANQTPFQPLIIQAKNGVATYIEMTYTTTDAPTSGAEEYFLEWKPRSSNAAVAAV